MIKSKRVIVAEQGLAVFAENFAPAVTLTPTAKITATDTMRPF